MNKIKFLTLIFLLIWINIANAACEIKSWPSKAISEYISDLDIALSSVKLNSNNSCSNANLKNPFQKWRSLVVNTTNSLFDFNEFTNSFKMLSFIYQWSIPEPVYRDYNLLKSQDEKINSMITYVSGKCALNNKIDSDSINGFISKYWKSSGLTAESILIDIKNINHEVFSDFTSMVTWDPSAKNSDYLGINNLISDFKNHYSDVWLIDCNEAYWSGFLEKIKDISKVTKGIDKWMKEWDDSFKLLFGITTSNKTLKEEKDLLEKELQRQWLKSDQISKITKNLNDMNACWLSPTCYAKEIWNRIYETFTDLWDKILTVFKNLKKNAKDVTTYSTLSRNISKTELIQKEIEFNYENLKTMMSIQNNVFDKNIENLVTIHANLQIYNNMEKAIKTAQDLCNSQWKWIWNCSF